MQDLADEQLHGVGFGGGGESGGWSSTMLLKQEIFDQADIGWLEQHYPKKELGNVQIKEEYYVFFSYFHANQIWCGQSKSL